MAVFQKLQETIELTGFYTEFFVYGTSISVSGKRAIIGTYHAHFLSHGTQSLEGYAYYYELINDKWQLTYRFPNGDAVSNYILFVINVKLDSDKLFIGSSENNQTFTYQYKSGQWLSTGSIIDDIYTNNRNMDVEENTAIVRFDNRVNVYLFNNNQWQETGVLDVGVNSIINNIAINQGNILISHREFDSNAKNINSLTLFRNNLSTNSWEATLNLDLGISEKSEWSFDFYDNHLILENLSIKNSLNSYSSNIMGYEIDQLLLSESIFANSFE